MLRPTSWSVFPNPAQAGAHLNLGQLNGASTMVRMLDLNGRQVLEEHIPAGMEDPATSRIPRQRHVQPGLGAEWRVVHNARLIVTQ